MKGRYAHQHKEWGPVRQGPGRLEILGEEGSLGPEGSAGSGLPDRTVQVGDDVVNLKSFCSGGRAFGKYLDNVVHLRLLALSWDTVYLVLWYIMNLKSFEILVPYSIIWDHSPSQQPGRDQERADGEGSGHSQGKDRQAPGEGSKWKII